MAYLTGRRVPEIGVRMALGARASEVLWMVLRQSLGMISLGVLAGVAAALAAGQVLQRLVEGMQPAEAVTFAVMVGILVIAALAASFVPAPVSALRQE